jgi:magnesium chelatase subunit I
LKAGLQNTSIRLADFMGVIPSITGKVELVYEGEQEGAASVAQKLISNAVFTLFPAYFPKIERLEKDRSKSAYAAVIEWFANEPGLELLDEASDEEYKGILDSVTPLNELISKYQPKTIREDVYFLKEFILWALVENKKLSKDRFVEGFQFSDLFAQ